MVSYHGYFQYQNIIQAEPIQKKVVCQIKEDTISGFLKNHPNFRLFSWIIKKADMELKMGHELFDSTLFVVDDDYLLKQFGSEDFFINLDKNEAYNILYAHLLNRKIHKKTLESQRLTKLFTKNEKTQIYFLNNYGNITLNNMANLIQEDIRLSNGVIHVIDRLLFPYF
jgi:hypothetical protein